MKFDINKLYSNLGKQGLEETRIKDIVNKAKEYSEYIDATNLENKDYITILKILEYAHFCATNCLSIENKSKWDSILLYSDDDVKIWNPRTFVQSSLIGLPIWCICFNESYWNEHVNMYHENVYMVYNVLEDSIHQYTCCLVSPNGKITIYDREHNRLDGMQVSQYLNTLGNGKQYLKPKQQLQENKQNTKINKNMKNQTIKLNESQLRKIIKESVKKVLKENIENPDNLSLRDFMTQYYDNDETCEEALSKLQDGRYVFGRGWEYVFHEGVGDGVYSPQEGIVAVFDEDDLPDYHSVNFYRFNPQSWLVLRDNENDERDWADTEQYDVEPIDESRLNRVIRESIRKILKK